MRLQLKRVGIAALSVAATLLPAVARADGVVAVDTGHTLYHEAPTRTNMTVYTPGVDVAATPTEWFTVRGGYEADVVSGASVATKAGGAYQSVNPGADVVTTASVHDLRHAPRGGVTFRKGDVAYTASYTYSTENDYKSHALAISARTDVFEHNTQFEIAYAKNFDLVCDRLQATNDVPARRRALENSSGCFAGSDPLRTRHALAVDGLQASWTQLLSPELTTQLVYTAQILDGFQSNPYRNVVLAQGLKAQEHHPGHRVRQSIAARANYFVRPIKLALRATARFYRDTWQVASGTGELEAERYFAPGLRLGLRARYYRQSGALFWSDDYTAGDPPLGPKGQYFTGDRELSPFTSGSLGLKFAYAVTPEQGKIAGFLTGLRVGGSGDVVQFDYDEYTLGGVPITSARAFLIGVNAGASF